VVLPNGSIDPWHALGILNDTQNSDAVAAFIIGLRSKFLFRAKIKEGIVQFVALVRRLYACLKCTGFLVNRPHGVLLKVPFFDLHMSA